MIKPWQKLTMKQPSKTQKHSTHAVWLKKSIIKCNSLLRLQYLVTVFNFFENISNVGHCYVYPHYIDIICALSLNNHNFFNTIYFTIPQIVIFRTCHLLAKIWPKIYPNSRITITLPTDTIQTNDISRSIWIKTGKTGPITLIRSKIRQCM